LKDTFAKRFDNLKKIVVMKVGFVGLGKLGLPCAEVMARHHIVYGYDIQPRLADGLIMCNKMEDLAREAEIIFIAVPTPHLKDYGGEAPSTHLAPRDFDYSALKDVVQLMAPLLKPEQLLVVISTVLPGTIRREIAPLMKNGHLVYNPYLIAMGTVQADFCVPEMVIIGTKDGDLAVIQKLTDFYKTLIHPDSRFERGTWEEAESIKIFYNTFISAKIALVNMIQDVSVRIGHMNVDVVTEALSSSNKRIMGSAYMRAGMGDGGPCHPRDNIALSWLSEQLHLGYDIFSGIMKAREEQAKNLAAFLAAFQLPVCIIGSSYKPDVPYTDGSYSLLVAHYLNESGVEVMFDYVTRPEAHTYLLSHPIPHPESDFHSGSIVVDPWRIFACSRMDTKVIHYGKGH
jgi:UDPglucose 6-dehydrogenase